MIPAVAVLLAALWLGAALLAAAVVAPAAFAVLPTRALAGALVGRVLPVLFVAGMVAGMVIAVLDLRDALPGRRARFVGGAVMLLACGFAQLVIAPRIARLRAAIGASIEALATDDPQRVAFGRLHALSVGWMGIAMVGAGAVIFFSLLALRARRGGT